MQLNETHPATTTTTKFQKFISFVYKFKFALLISLVGGVPGLINIWNWINHKPEFVFHTETISYGDFYGLPNQTGTHYKFYLISGAIYNSGNEPLFPFTFDIEATYRDTVIFSQAEPVDSSTPICQYIITIFQGLLK